MMIDMILHVNSLTCPFKDEPCEGCTIDSECDILFSNGVYYDCTSQVKVFMNKSSIDMDKCAFERIIDVNSSLDIPFNSLLSDLRFLYGLSSVVQFNII